MGSLLTVKDLTVDLNLYEGRFRAIDRVSFQVDHDQWTGMVGETGCGKTITALSIMGLLPRAAEITAGSILLHGKNLLLQPEAAMRSIRGSGVSMIFQNPKTACNPALKIGTQLVETIRTHCDASVRDATRTAVALLHDVGLEAYCMSQYAHELSGGMLQRVMIALALSCTPELILADEPTSSLDVTVQRDTLALMRGISRERGLAILLITHDLLLVLQHCSKVVVMYAGMVVEKGPCDAVFADPRHPYTKAILRAIVDVTARRDKLEEIPGNPPDLHASFVSGCRFRQRCPCPVDQVCDRADPVEADLGRDHFVCCHLYRMAPA